MKYITEYNKMDFNTFDDFDKFDVEENNLFVPNDFIGHEDFYNFLYKRGLYKKFINNYDYNMPLRLFLIKINSINYILTAFLWSKDLSVKWGLFDHMWYNIVKDRH